MYKKILFAADLEGVNFVVGQEYCGLGVDRSSEQYAIAIREAALEINAAAEALFDIGVEEIALWDNHAGGNNIDPDTLDKRINIIKIDFSKPRMWFGGEYDCVCFFGYHAMEGTLGGVLAHTMNSKENQHYKLNGKYIGEVDMDAYIAASFGTPSCFFAGGDIACSQAKRSLPHIVTVATKKEISRNKAEFRDNDELFADIKKGIVEAVTTDAEAHALDFPATLEKSFKRTEDAAKYFARLAEKGIKAEYADDDVLGKDAHTVVSKVFNIDDFIKCI